MDTITELKEQLAEALRIRERILMAPSRDANQQAANIHALNRLDKDLAAIRKSLRDEENAPCNT